MNKKSYLVILFNPLIIGLYVIFMYKLWEFCKYGDVKAHMPWLIGLVSTFVIWLIVWSILYFKMKKKGKSVTNIKTSYVVAEIIMMLIVTVAFGYKIYDTTKEFNGKLGWYLWEKNNTEKIELTHNNIYSDGLDGIFNDIKDKIDIPNELYIVNAVNVNYNEDGTITNIYAFLYGKDDNGDKKTYLIDYDSSKDSKMTVYLDNEAPNVNYEAQNKLQPMKDMVNAIFKSEYSKLVKLNCKLNYSGYVSAGDSDLYRLMNDVIYPIDSTDLNTIDNGYILSFSSSNNTIIKVITEADTMTPKEEIKNNEKNNEIKKEAAKNKECIQDDKGYMTFYFTEDINMRLKIEDAAAGSRFYSFQNINKKSGNVISNDNPFKDEIGVAEGIYFTDENHGFILLTNSSGDHSQMYYTEDGGKTFNKVELNISGAKVQNYAISDFDYVGVPFEKDNKIHVKVSLEAASIDTEFIELTSSDNGKTFIRNEE